MTYDSIVETASRLIEEKGRAITIRKSVTGFFDPVTGDTIPDADVDHPTHGVFLAPSTSFMVRTGTLEIDAQWRVLIAGKDLPFELTAADRVIDGDGKAFSIVGPIQKTAPDGTVILYDVFVRT